MNAVSALRWEIRIFDARGREAPGLGSDDCWNSESELHKKTPSSGVGAMYTVTVLYRGQHYYSMIFEP